MPIASGRATPKRRPRTGRPRGPAPDPSARREELLEAAVRAVRRLGPSASMDDIAAEAGLTKPILYAAFGDKAGLAAALAERLLSKLTPAVLAPFESDAAPQDMVRSAIDTFIAFVHDDPDVYRFLVRGVSASEKSFVEQRLVAELGSRLGGVVSGALSAAKADAGPAELWAFSILGTVLTGAEWWLQSPTMSRAELVDHLAAFVWGGLTAGGITSLGRPAKDAFDQ